MDSYLYFTLYGAYLLSVLLTVLHILLNMRDDSERASMWLIVVLAFPIGGIVLYLFAGLNRRNTLGANIEKARNEFDDPQNQSIIGMFARHSSEIAQYIAPQKDELNWNATFKLMLDRNFPDNPPLCCNQVELLCDGDIAYPKMIEAIQKAKHNILLQSYIIANDSVGKRIFDALEEKAEEGVKVKVLYDNFGSFGAIISHFFYRYSHRSKNIQIHAFSHSNLFTPWRVQLRNHRKLLVVDGETAFLGGINISADNFRVIDMPHPAIHDLHCMLRGPSVGTLQMVFLRDWCYAVKLPPDDVLKNIQFPSPEPCGNNIVRVVDSGHGHTYQGTEKTFFTAAATAKHSIWINTPYFVPDHAFIKALRIAALRGVDVRIILPKNNNHWYMKLASRNLYESLMEDGVRVFERKGNFSHAKAMIVDGEWVFFGSSNCDIRSFRLNYELDIVVSGGDFISVMHAQFLDEFFNSEEVAFDEVRRRTLPVRLMQSICALFTPIL